nr:MAG TPA: hypothetical protein [Caudoviricetes sp.]
MLGNRALSFGGFVFLLYLCSTKKGGNALRLWNGNERKKPRARFTTNNGANFFLKSLQRYGN